MRGLGDGAGSEAGATIGKGSGHGADWGSWWSSSRLPWRIVTYNEMVVGRVAERKASRLIGTGCGNIALRPTHVGGAATSGVMLRMAAGLKRPLLGSNSATGPFKSPPWENQGATNLAGPGTGSRGLTVSVLLRRSVRVRPQRADCPESLAEVGPLVEILDRIQRIRASRISDGVHSLSWRGRAGVVAAGGCVHAKQDEGCGAPAEEPCGHRVDMKASPPPGRGGREGVVKRSAVNRLAPLPRHQLPSSESNPLGLLVGEVDFSGPSKGHRVPATPGRLRNSA